MSVWHTRTSPPRPALGAILALGLVALLAGSDAFAAAGRFIAVVGDVKLVRASGQVQQVARGARIERGDAVITGQRGLAQLRMSDGGMLSVRPASEMKVDDYAFKDDEASAGRMFLSLLRGGLRSITGLIGSRNRSGYRVKTPHATIGVRGTDHETTVLLQARNGFQPGTFDVVYSGRTIMSTAVSSVEIAPRQAGYVTATGKVPRVIQVPSFLKPQGAAAPATPATAGAQKGQKTTRKQDAPAARSGGATPATPSASPSTTTLIPSTRTLTPSTQILSPSLKTLRPSTTALQPSTKTLAPSTKLLSPSITTLPPSTRTLSPSTTTLSPTTRTLSPSTTTLSPTTRTLSPATTTLSPSTTVAPSTRTLSPSTTTVQPSKTTIKPSTRILSPSKTLSPSTTTIKR